MEALPLWIRIPVFLTAVSFWAAVCMAPICLGSWYLLNRRVKALRVARHHLHPKENRR